MDTTTPATEAQDSGVPAGPRVALLCGVPAIQGSTPWRVEWPVAELRRQGYPVELLGQGFQAFMGAAGLGARPAAERPDALVVAKWLGVLGVAAAGVHQFFAAMRSGKTRGIALLYDTDDDETDPEAVLGYAAVQARLHGWVVAAVQAAWQAAIPAHAAMLQEADGITVVTPRLAQTVRRSVRPGTPVRVVPNAISAAPYLNAQQAASWGGERLPGTQGYIAVGWAGTVRLDRDVEALAEAWRRLARRYATITFVTVGYPPPPLVAAVPESRLVAVPRCGHDEYVHALASIDIGCCPLAPTAWNANKSPQKAWEFALCGAAVVCSPTVYGDPDVHAGFEAHGGLIAHDADEWEAHLARLIERREERRARVARLVPWVKAEHSMETQWERWPAAWRELVAPRRPG